MEEVGPEVDGRRIHKGIVVDEVSDFGGEVKE